MTADARQIIQKIKKIGNNGHERIGQHICYSFSSCGILEARYLDTLAVHIVNHRRDILEF